MQIHMVRVVLYTVWCTAIMGSGVGMAWAGPAASLKPRPLKSEAYGETYTAIGDFEDGSYVLLQLLFTNAGLGDQKAACRATVVPRQGPPISDSGRIDRDGWQFKSDMNRLEVKYCQIEAAEARTSFRVNVDAATVEMELARTARVTEPPGHELKTDDGFYRAQILVPWSSATLKITPRGQPTRTTKGKAYLDRTLSNVLLPDIADAWYRFRGFFGKEPVLVEIRYPPKKAPPVGWMWRSSDNRPVSLDGPIELKQEKNSMELHFTRQGRQFHVRSGEIIYEYEPVKEHGFMGRIAKPWIGDPKISTFRAKLTGVGTGPIRGILESADITP